MHEIIWLVSRSYFLAKIYEIKWKFDKSLLRAYSTVGPDVVTATYTVFDPHKHPVKWLVKIVSHLPESQRS